MPTEIKEIAKLTLNNKNIMKENKKYNEIYKFTSNCINTYGILIMDELYTLCNKFKFNINIDELNNILNNYMYVDEEFNLYEFNDNILVASMEFDNLDEVQQFYENSDGDLNTKLSLDTIEDKYIPKLKSYKKLIDFLDDRYEGVKEDHELFDEFIVFDYVYSAQTSIEIANKNFNENINDFFEINKSDKKIVLKMLEDIYNECPKWSKRGNI